MTEETLARFRLHFHKTRTLRFIGHLDLHRSLERTLRRTQLPLDYSKGFNPRLKLNLSSALPLGCSSTTELADFWLLNDRDEQEVLESLRKQAPPGLSFISVEKIDMQTPSLQSQIDAVTYIVELPDSVKVNELSSKVSSLLASSQLERTRRGKPYDLRPLILSLELLKDQQDRWILRMKLRAAEGMTGRPEEVLRALSLDPAETLIERTKLFLTD